jgi:CBS domain-containing protein
MLTDRDIVVSVLAGDGEQFDVLRVGDVMSRAVVTAREDEPLADALKRMRVHGIRRLPVVDAGGNLIGLLAFDDLVEHVSRELEDLAALIAHEQEQERELRV